MREWVIWTGLMVCAAVAFAVVHTYVTWRREIAEYRREEARDAAWDAKYLGARDE